MRRGAGDRTPVNQSPRSMSFFVWSWNRLISICLQHQRWFPLPAALTAWGCVEQTGPVLSDTAAIPNPDPLLPIPSPDQLAWQTQELSAFLHFGLNTFSNQEQG